MNTLVGKVVRLEPLATHHSQGLFAVLGHDEEAFRWWLVNTPKSLEDMSAIVGKFIEEFNSGMREPYAVVHVASERVIGTTSFMDISRHDRTVEIGSTIYAREYWRTAVNTESKLLMLTEAFDVQKFLRVTFKTDSKNERSQAAILRTGATYEGTLRWHKIRADGTSRDSMYYSILSTEWPQVRANLQKALG